MTPLIYEVNVIISLIYWYCQTMVLFTKQMMTSSVGGLLLAWMFCSRLTTAAKMVNYKYFSEGETVVLSCMSGANTTDWIGPAHNSLSPSSVTEKDSFGNMKTWNITKYTDNRHINPILQNVERLGLIGNENFDLEIRNATLFDEGYYSCAIDPVKGNQPHSKSYILQFKTQPSNLTICNVTDQDTIIGTEHQKLKLVCNVKSGIPPETIHWKKNGIILKPCGPKRCVYELPLIRKDHNANLTCEVSNEFIKQTKTVRLYIQYIPKVSIDQEETGLELEGSKKKLCCQVDSNPNISFIIWHKDRKMQNLKMNSMCLVFDPLTRQDHGNYTCVAGNKIGNGTFTAALKVSYPPTVSIKYKNMSIYMDIQCNADGVPDKLTFFRVEHKSLFDEHIRFLNVSADGIATLPPIEESDRYQNTGVYVCNASNGVSDSEGNEFQQGEAYLVSNGPPIFLAANKKIQYGQIGKPMDLIIKVYSTSNITCFHLNAIGRKFADPVISDIKEKTVISTNNFHGVDITVNGIQVTFRLSELRSYQSYNVTICNKFSKNNVIVEVRKRDITSKRENNVTSILGGCIGVGSIILVVMSMIIFRKRQQTGSINIEEVSDVVEGISIPVENIMYQSVQQGQHDTEHPSPASTLLPDISSENTDTLSRDMEEGNQSIETRLNYADVVFQPSSRNEIRIIGIEDRNVYADVDTSVAAALMPETRSETSSSDDDFVYVDGIENFIEKRETND